ncbi:MAG: hypothetical protein FWC40_08945, partial [Proteobacteria bacterium]|nr:hypothetical protein [Pseudomonadota bacterium]
DMTGDMARFGVDEGVLGDWLRVHIKRHLGLTVSVGVSFNKVFAKLASDLKKPDAVTVIGFEDFSVRVSGVGVSQLLGVGRQTAMKLRRCGIQTIGQLARSDVCFLRGMFGKCGEDLWRHANGLDASPVRTPQESSGRQTLGHGTTLPFDYADAASLWPVVLQLSERVWHGLVAEGLRTRGLALTVRDASLRFHLYQCRFRHCLVSSANMAGLVLMMLRQQYDWLLPVRAIQVRALYLESVSAPRQGELFAQAGVGQWLESGGQAIDAVMGTINGRLGSHTLRRASLLKGISTQPCLMPGVSVPGGDSLD